MIDNPLLALVVRHIADLAASGESAETRSAEQVWLEQTLVTEASDGRSWHKLLLDSYCGLERHDLASIPLRAHHWLVERVLADARDDIRVRNGFFADLFELLDPFGRHMTIKVLVGRPEFNEQFPRLVAGLSDSPRDRQFSRARELAEIVLDLRFGTPQRVRERAAAFGASSATEALGALIQLSRQYGLADAVGNAVLTRANRAGGEIEAELLALLNEGDGFTSR